MEVSGEKSRGFLILNKRLKLIGIGALALLCAPTVSAHESYPAYVTNKKLFAERDLRGQSGPRILVDEWISGKAPKLENKVVLFDFWATWCPPCRKLIPELNEFQRNLPTILS